MVSDTVGHSAKVVMTYSLGRGGCHRVLKKCFKCTVAFMHSSGKPVRYNISSSLKYNMSVQEYFIAYCTYWDVVKSLLLPYSLTRTCSCVQKCIFHLLADVRELPPITYYFRKSQCCRFQELWVRGGTLMRHQRYAE